MQELQRGQDQGRASLGVGLGVGVDDGGQGRGVPGKPLRQEQIPGLPVDRRD